MPRARAWRSAAGGSARPVLPQFLGSGGGPRASPQPGCGPLGSRVAGALRRDPGPRCGAAASVAVWGSWAIGEAFRGLVYSAGEKNLTQQKP